MFPKWIFGLMICAVGNILTARRDEDNVFECPEPGCNRQFMSANGRRRHFQRQHLGMTPGRKSCPHGCGKTYASNQKAALHGRTCERNPNR